MNITSHKTAISPEKEEKRTEQKRRGQDIGQQRTG